MTLEVIAVGEGYAVFRVGMHGRKEFVAFFVRAADAHLYRNEKFLPSCYEVRAAVFEGDLVVADDPHATPGDVRATSTTEAPPAPNGGDRRAQGLSDAIECIADEVVDDYDRVCRDEYEEEALAEIDREDPT